MLPRRAADISEAVIAMTYQSETIGLVSLGQKKSGRMFSMEDLDLLQTMTSQTEIALQNARLFDDLSASLKHIQILESIKTNLAKFVPPCASHRAVARDLARFRVGLGLLSNKQRERFADLGIIEFEHETTSDVDHDMQMQLRVRSGEVALPA